MYNAFRGFRDEGRHLFAFSAMNPVVGQQGTFYVCPAQGIISAWNLVVDAGTATVKVWKKATGIVAPTIADVINTTGLSIVTGTALRSTDLSDFTTINVAKGDIFAFDLTAVATATRVLFEIEVQKRW